MINKLLVWILFAVPEGLMMVIAGLGLLGIRRPFRKMALAGVLVGTGTMIFRAFIPNGYHVPLVLIFYCLLLVLVLRVSAKTSILACFLSSILINLGQLLIALPILRIAGLSFQDTLANIWLHIGFGWLGEIIILICSIMVIVRRRPLIPVPESEYLRGANGP
ncbi:MAG TPA: hypothetical protein GX509_00675 [Firmicutes bacterium]|nr:hypothetical protein [Bacillota bacterium]